MIKSSSLKRYYCKGDNIIETFSVDKIGHVVELGDLNSIRLDPKTGPIFPPLILLGVGVPPPWCRPGFWFPINMLLVL